MNAEEIIAQIPWRCFHCDFITMDPKEAAAHFGDRDDAEEFKPLCKWWTSLTEDDRVLTLQDTLKQLNDEQDENYNLRNKLEVAEAHINGLAGNIKTFKPFRECHSIYDVFCVYDSMEGRALAAEARANGKDKETATE